MIQPTDPVIRAIIQNFDDTRFAALCNALLSEMVARHGLDRSCLATNLNVKEPDGGIDARCVGSSLTVGRIIPRTNVDYQFKSGSQNKSAAKIAEEDIYKKPRVLQGLQDGHAFVYIAAWDRSDKIEDEIIAELAKHDMSVASGQIIFIGLDQVIRLLLSFPTLIVRFLHIGIPLIEVSEWAFRPALRNPYVMDAELEAELEDLRNQVEKPSSRVRLVGAAGNGKTRMALEALRHSDLVDRVLYAEQASCLEPNFTSYLRRTPDIVCIIVVDEVDDDQAEHLINQFSSMPSGVRLVMIGLDASGRAQPGTLQVEGLSEDLLVQMILAIVPGLSQDVVRTIARDCENSPKLAVLIAGRIRDDPELVAPFRLLTDGAVWKALDRYLSIDRSSAEWEALSTAAADSTQPGASLMPLLPLILSRGKLEIAVSGLLDTGAAVNVLPYSLGEQLGFVWEQQRTSIVLSGNLARLPARGIVLSAMVSPFAPVRLAFAWTQTDNVRVLLGQANFVLGFDVCFFRSRSEFEIRPRAAE